VHPCKCVDGATIHGLDRSCRLQAVVEYFGSLIESVSEVQNN
jgi:hypothetical protein